MHRTIKLQISSVPAAAMAETQLMLLSGITWKCTCVEMKWFGNDMECIGDAMDVHVKRVERKLSQLDQQPTRRHC